jgi:hypothetical protein
LAQKAKKSKRRHWFSAKKSVVYPIPPARNCAAEHEAWVNLNTVTSSGAADVEPDPAGDCSTGHDRRGGHGAGYSYSGGGDGGDAVAVAVMEVVEVVEVVEETSSDDMWEGSKWSAGFTKCLALNMVNSQSFV